MLFPNCREKYTKKAFPCGMRFRKLSDIPDDEINPYWDKNLKGARRTFIDGYDEAVLLATEKMFSYYEDDLKDVLYENIGVDGDEESFDEEFAKLNIDFDVLADEKSIYDYSFEEKQKWSVTTALLMALKLIMVENLECERNEMVTFMIENQESEEQDGSEKILPIPCDGELYKDWTLDDYMAKVTEEYSELVLAYKKYKTAKDKTQALHELAEESTDLIIATTSFQEKAGLNEYTRQKYLKAKNASNRKRDKGKRIK